MRITFPKIALFLLMRIHVQAATQKPINFD